MMWYHSTTTRCCDSVNTMGMWKAGVSVWRLIMETRETIPVRCTALSVCNGDCNVTLATVENPFKHPQTHTYFHIKLAKTHTEQHSTTVSQILMLKTTTHINIMIRPWRGLAETVWKRTVSPAMDCCSI